MESLARPLRALHEDASWFARATEIKLLHVQCDASMRSSALKVLGSMEGHASNRSPYVLLEDAWKTAAPGWKMRAERLAAHWEERRRLTTEVELGKLTEQAAGDTVGAFGACVQRAVNAVPRPLDGLVIVLAPPRVEDPVVFEAELRELVLHRDLRAVRWIVVDVFEAPLEGLREELGARALRAECKRDEGALANDLAALMTSVDPALPGPAKAGAAWPRGVLPPRRKTEPDPTDEQRIEAAIELAAAGVSPVLAGEHGQRLEQYVMAAAIAMKRGDGASAINYQREACRIAFDAQAKREGLLMWMVLAGYELALGHEADAEREYRGVADRAELEGCPLERAQAGLALALMAARRGVHAEAAREYAVAADAALAAGATGLAIECWRLAGHMASEVGLSERAAECWLRAIELAEDAEPSAARSSSAPRAARELAEKLRERGQTAQATALEHQANRLEAGDTRAAREAQV